MDRHANFPQEHNGQVPAQQPRDHSQQAFPWFGTPADEPGRAETADWAGQAPQIEIAQRAECAPDAHTALQAWPAPDARTASEAQLAPWPLLAPKSEPAPEAEHLPAYEIPDVPETGWSAEQSRRRVWIGRALLLCVLLIQTALSLRLHNTAYQDEALYLLAGRLEIGHLLHGTVLTTDYASYFSGSPWLYPVLAGGADMVLGLTGARLLSLLLMLGATALLYSLTRQLFNERVAISAAAVYSVLGTTAVLGFYATYDALAIFLIALAAWIVVRTARGPVATVLSAAPVAALAVGVKYASGLFLPTLVVFAIIVAWPYQGSRAVLRGLLLAPAIGGLLAVGAVYGHVLTGVQATTTARAHGTDSAESILLKSAQWGGLLFAAACAGAVAYVWRERMHEVPNLEQVRSTRRWRAALAVLMCGTALLAPAYQAYLHTSVSLYKHLGFGLLFAAPLAGIGITRLIGAHFRQPQLGILAWVVMLALGISQSTWRFTSWPDSTQLTTVLRAHVNSTGRYLTEADNVLTYYLREQTSPNQWTTTYGIGYLDPRGIMHHGNDGYRTAVKNGYFDLIVLDGMTTPDTDKVVTTALLSNGHYRLIAQLPFGTSIGPGAYRIYLKQ